MSFTFSKLLTHMWSNFEEAAPFDNTSSQTETCFWSKLSLVSDEVKAAASMKYGVSQKKLRTEWCWSHCAQVVRRSQVILRGKFGFTALNFGWDLFPLVTLFWDTLCICLISKATERERGGQVLVSWAHPDESELEEDATLSVDLLCPDFLTSSWELNLSEGELACCAPCERVWPWGAHD